MKRRSLVLCALMWAGCPGIGGGGGAGGSVGVLRMPLQSESFAIVQAQFAAVFPRTPLVEPDVKWWTSQCPGKTETAVILNNKCYSGLHYRTGGIDVAWRGSVGQSAYSHELMHYFLKKSGQDEDADHKRADVWAVVNQTDEMLVAKGI